MHIRVVIAKKAAHNVSTESERDRGALFGQDQTFAEVACVVVAIEQTVQDADLVRNLGQCVDERRLGSIWLAWRAHAFEHIGKRPQHIEVHLCLGGYLWHWATVVFKLVFAAEEDSSFTSLEELG